MLSGLVSSNATNVLLSITDGGRCKQARDLAIPALDARSAFVDHTCIMDQSNPNTTSSQAPTSSRVEPLVLSIRYIRDIIPPI